MSELGYCAKKDKRQLTEADARATAAGVGGMSAYLCPLCKYWHVASVGGGVHKKNRRGRNQGQYPDIFEVRTPDYEPDELVMAVPPEDYVGDHRSWYNRVLDIIGWKVGVPKGGVPMIRAADHARLVAELEP